MPDDGVMRNLGKFVGAIWHGVKADPDVHKVRREVEESVEEHDGKKVIVRRTTIEEIEVRDDTDDKS